MARFFQKSRRVIRLLPVLALSLPLVLALPAHAGEMITEAPEALTGQLDDPQEEAFVENEWNFVENSMDVSGGIPADAGGRLHEIREAGKLVVATEPYYAPQEFIDPSLSGQDQYVGADIELAKRIAQYMGVELELVPLELGDVLTAAQQGTCDLAISGLAYTPGRASSLELSKGYHYAAEGSGAGLLVREEDLDKITSIADLARMDLVAQRGSLQEMLMAENITAYRQFRRVLSSRELYQQLQDGTSDAAAVDVEAARIYLHSNPDSALALVDGISFKLDEQFEGDRIAARKGEIELMYFVNGVIDQVLASGEYEEWFETYTDYASDLGL